MQVKAAGRFKEADDVLAALDAGAARVASGFTSVLVQAFSEAVAAFTVGAAETGTVGLRS